MIPPHYETKHRIETYKEIRAAWRALYKKFQSEFGPGNQLDLAFPESSQETIKSFSVLGHDCRVSLMPFFVEGRISGKLLFERITGQDEWKSFLVFYIDEHGNAGLEPERVNWSFSRPNSNDINSAGMIMAGAFLNSYMPK